MQVILLRDIAGVGKKYDVKNVSDGYATNFLLPKKMASVATAQMIERFNIEKLKDNEEKNVQDNLMEKNLAALAGVKIVIKAKASKQGHLFAQIHKEEISKALKEAHVDLPEEYIVLEEHIKTIGVHKIPVNFKGNLPAGKAWKSEFELIVEAEE